MTHMIFSFFLIMFPWPLRRILMNIFLRYKLHPQSRIGFSLIMPTHLSMGSGARIGHLTICKGIESLDMEENTHIGNLNWITGFPLRGHRHYKNQQDRFPSLFIGRHAAITNRHLIDCSDRVIIGQYSTFAGFRSQILTHYINIATNRQMTRPVTIGKYSFVGTQSVFLPGSVLPDYSILSANSLLNKAFNEPYCLYGGVPAEKIKTIPRDSQYFTRESGYVE